MTRGFTTATIWAPTMRVNSFDHAAYGAEWVHFFPVGIACGVLTGVVGLAVTMAEGRNVTLLSGVTPAAAARPRPSVDTRHAQSSAALAERASNGQSDYRKFGQLCIFALILMISIALISYVTGAHTIAVVSVAALVYPVLWMGLLGRLPVLCREFRLLCPPDPAQPQQRGDPLCSRGHVRDGSHLLWLGQVCPASIVGACRRNVLLLTIAMVVLSVALAAVGVHPIVTVAVFGGTMRAASLARSATWPWCSQSAGQSA